MEPPPPPLLSLLLLLLAAGSSTAAAAGDGCSVGTGCDLALGSYLVGLDQNATYIGQLFGLRDNYRLLQPYNPGRPTLDYIIVGDHVNISFPCRCLARPADPATTYLAGSFPHQTLHDIAEVLRVAPIDAVPAPGSPDPPAADRPRDLPPDTPNHLSLLLSGGDARPASATASSCSLAAFLFLSFQTHRASSLRYLPRLVSRKNSALLLDVVPVVRGGPSSSCRSCVAACLRRPQQRRRLLLADHRGAAMEPPPPPLLSLLLLILTAGSSTATAVGDGCSMGTGCDLALGSYLVGPDQNTTYIGQLFGLGDNYRLLQPYNPGRPTLDYIIVGDRVNVSFPCRCLAWPADPAATYLAGSFPHQVVTGQTYTPPTPTRPTRSPTSPPSTSPSTAPAATRPCPRTTTSSSRTRSGAERRSHPSPPAMASR
ncbi:hypothetical protein ACQ4PT_060394 [Festuca glaucescens]